MNKLDRLIEIIRELKEEMSSGGMTTGSSGNTAGFSGAANSAGPTAGYDPIMTPMQRRRKIIGAGKYPGARTRWKNGLR